MHHLFIPIVGNFVWYVGQWHKKVCMRVKNLFLLELKELKKAFKGEHKSSTHKCICRKMYRCLWGEFRAQLQWKMNETIDLSLWETTHEYWAITRDRVRERGRLRRVRDRNQNEKWGTRLKDCTVKEKGMVGMRRLRWVDRAFYWERRLEKRHDMKESLDE